MRKVVFVGLGSNLGDRLANLQAACNALAGVSGLRLLRCSSVVESAAWGYESANPYLNAVLEVEYEHNVWSLLDNVLNIEALAGRDIDGRIPTWRENSTAEIARRLAAKLYADRRLDVDILWMDGVDLLTPLLSVPHPQAQHRAFVLAPWSELTPELFLHGRPLIDWLRQLPAAEREAVKTMAPPLFTTLSV